jgi:RNA polymerase sigma-70 factor, ECF subfamily
MYTSEAVGTSTLEPRPLRFTAGTDEDLLIAALRTGDPRAYEKLVCTHGGRMLAVSRRLLRCEEDARDAVQDAFLQAFRALPRFAGQSCLGTWLHRIAVNACLMRLRSRKSKPEESIETFLPTFLEDGHQTVPAVEWEPCDRLMERQEVRQMVRDAIDRLPESYRTVLMLRDIEEMSTAEVAEALSITENAVKVRLHRARQALRELVDARMREVIP